MVNVAKFDRQDVVKKACYLFWEKGFHGTSMRNLQQAVDLRPGSIYATFGSKEELFGETLHYYANESKNRMDKHFAEESSPLSALKSFIYEMVVTAAESDPSNACMLVKTVAELTEDEHSNLLTTARAELKSLEDKFCWALERAKEAGEISAAADTRELAIYLQVQMMGLKTYSQAYSSNEQICSLLHTIFSRLE